MRSQAIKLLEVEGEDYSVQWKDTVMMLSFMSSNLRSNHEKSAGRQEKPGMTRSKVNIGSPLPGTSHLPCFGMNKSTLFSNIC